MALIGHIMHHAAYELANVLLLGIVQAKALGFYMFSRQTMIMSAEQVDENGHYPMHQPDSVVKAEVDLMLSWLSCIEGSAV